MAELDETHAGDARPSSQLVAGSQLGRFTLRRVLGEGGMGVVWAAHDPDLDREIAIKLLRHHVPASPALRKRLLREARAMARLKHPNVITVYEVGSSGDTDFIAMELVDGVTVDEWLAHDPSRADVWRALLAAGHGLAAAHRADLVHRDFKPHNVLRSRDGRVLVTDFGLARGLGDEAGGPVETAAAATPLPSKVPAGFDETIDAPAFAATTPDPRGKAAASKPISRSDSLLDSPLTQTGAMIGTPAYMAPEQFHGAPPDPRTDQFAYCVTAWQMLTGARPFIGETLEELRRSAAAGVENVVAPMLAKPVRAALARGLDREPSRRWPDMNALLDALEGTQKPPRRTWPFVLAGAVVVAAMIFVIGARRTDEPRRATTTCEPAETVFAEAWSDSSRAELALNVSDAAVGRVARGFEQFRTKWSASYQEACNAPPSKTTDARLACLRGARDQTAALRVMLRMANQRVFEQIDLHAMLPNLTMCSGPAPVAPTEVPHDQPRRQKILQVIASSIALRGVDRLDLGYEVERLVADANAIGWKPLVSMVQVSAGNAYLQNADYEHARTMFRGVPKDADMRVQATAHLGLFEAALGELEKPGYGTVTPKPGALHEELARALTYAKSSVRAAGNDPMLEGSAALLEAEAKAAVGLWSRYRQPYKLALELTAEARKDFEKAGDYRRAADVAAREGWIYLWRGNDRALDDALFIARSAEEAMQTAQIDRAPALDELRGKIAFAKGELAEAHRRYDAFSPATPTGDDVVTYRGRVVDRANKPVAGATVVAWFGELHGDPVRVYTDPRFTGYMVETAADGTFSITSPGPTAVVAETREGRSRISDNWDLVIEPTTSLNGKIDGDHPMLVEVFARFTTNRSTWFVHAPLAKDGAYQLGGLPRGPYVLGLVGPAGNGTRYVTGPKLAWPNGPAIEVILRAKGRRDTARAWIVRGKVTAKKRTELDAIVAKSSDVAIAAFHPVGADATDAGRELYEAGDQHAIVIGNAPGDASVCIALGAHAEADVYCSSLVLRDTPDDGHTHPGVTPVLFETD